MMEQGCLHLPGRATIKATEYRELIEDRLSALNLLAEKNRELVAADNRLEAQEEQRKMLEARLETANNLLEMHERFFSEHPFEKSLFEKWQKQREEEALPPFARGTGNDAALDGDGGAQ